MNIYSFIKNECINTCDFLGLYSRSNVQIHVIYFSGDDNIGYERGQKDSNGKSNEEIRKGTGKGKDINGYGGFIAYAIGNHCCDGGNEGKIKLVQLFWNDKKKEWEVDTTLDKTIISSRKKEKKIIGYLDPDDPGRAYDKYGYQYDYIEAPGLGEVINWLHNPYDKSFRVEAFCDCGGSDFYLEQAIEFRFKRGRWDSNGSLSNVNNRPNSPSVYPNYKSQADNQFLRKGYVLPSVED